MDTPNFAIPQEHRAPFTKHYQKHIAPICRKLEAKRGPLLVEMERKQKRAQPLLRITWPLFIGSLIGIGLSTLRILPVDWMPWLFGAAIVIFLTTGYIYWWAGKAVSNFLTEGMEKLFPKVLSYFGKDYHLVRDGSEDVGRFGSYGVFPKHDTKETYCYLKGSHHQIPFEFFEVRFATKKGDNKYETVFRGVILAFKVKKRFQGTTRIRQDGGFLKGLFQDSLERVKLEDALFESRFEVYGDDQIQARYLLNPGMMTRFIQLNDHFGRGLEACFKDEHLLIKLPTSRRFFDSVLSIYEPLDFKEPIEEVFADLDFIFGIADELALHQHTGL